MTYMPFDLIQNKKNHMKETWNKGVQKKEDKKKLKK